MVGMEPHFPAGIRRLPTYAGRFEAHKLSAEGCEVLFASYPGGSEIEPHSHGTENHGVVTGGELILEIDGEERGFKPGEWYHISAKASHSARFEVDTHMIEFWFQDPG